MNDAIFDDIAIEKSCKETFGLNAEIKEVIARAVPAGIATRATVFTTTNGQAYLFVVSQGVQLLADVQKIVLRMQCEAQTFLPPYGEPEYFERIGREKFKIMFPGKPIISDEDLRYYKSLAPYNPGLVRLARVKGELRGFDRESKMWRKVKDYAYSTIKTN